MTQIQRMVHGRPTSESLCPAGVYELCYEQPQFSPVATSAVCEIESMNSARVTSFFDNPPTECVVKVMSTRSCTYDQLSRATMHIFPLRMMIEFLRPQSNPRHESPCLAERLELQRSRHCRLFSIRRPFG